MNFKFSTLLVLLTLVSSCSSIKVISNKESNFDRKVDAFEIDEIEMAYLDEVSKEAEEVPVKAAAPKIIVEKKISQEVISEKVVEREVVKKSDLHLNYKKRHFDFWTKYFSHREVKRFKRHLENGHRYKSVIQSIFKEHNLPEDLYYVGLIESGYNLRIRSHAQAVGPWQFIKGTGTRYGLRIDSSVDERYNLVKATHAAAGYFKDLYNIFGSWDLALCAYNAGEYRIINAIRRGNTRNYQELVKKKLLPKETIYYLPKVAAAKELAESKRFRAKRNYVSVYRDVKPVLLKRSFSLSKISQKLKVNYRTLKKINPDIKKSWVKVGRRGHNLLVPAAIEHQALTFAESYSKKSKRNRKLAQSSESSKRSRRAKTYRVRRGDNLSKIASKFGVELGALRALNKIKGNRLFAGRKIKIPAPSGKLYTVRRGDTLTKIARQFGTSIRTLVAHNRLKGRTIFPQQKLMIPENS